jgi:WD40 repeat protein
MKLWNIDGSERATIATDQSGGGNVRFSPDGKTIISSGEYSILRLWNNDGSEHTTITTYQDGGSSVNFSPDGKTVISGGYDGSVKRWNADGTKHTTIKTNWKLISKVNSVSSKVISCDQKDSPLEFCDRTDDITVEGSPRT